MLRSAKVQGLDPSCVLQFLSPVILQLMIESSQQLVSPEVDDMLKQFLELEAKPENCEEFVALHLALISCLHAHLKTKSVTVGDLYPHATVMDAAVWEKPISMIARTVARCDAIQTPRKCDANKHPASVLLPGKSQNFGLDVAMPYGRNQCLLFQDHQCSENHASGTAIAREVLRQYGLIEDGQNALPGA